MNIKFQYHYFKMDNEEFTTIRGKSWFLKMKMNSVCSVAIKNNYFCMAEIIRLELKKIIDLKLDFLKKDVEYQGFSIFDHFDFIDKINSFRAPYYEQATTESKVTIIYLKKVKQKPKLEDFLDLMT